MNEAKKGSVVERIADALRAEVATPRVELELKRELMALSREGRRLAGLELAMLSAVLIRQNRTRYRSAVIEIGDLLQSIDQSLSTSSKDPFTRASALTMKLLGLR